MEIMQGEAHSGPTAKNGFHIFKGKNLKEAFNFMTLENYVKLKFLYP